MNEANCDIVSQGPPAFGPCRIMFQNKNDDPHEAQVTSVPSTPAMLLSLSALGKLGLLAAEVLRRPLRSFGGGTASVRNTTSLFRAMRLDLVDLVEAVLGKVARAHGTQYGRITGTSKKN